MSKKIISIVSVFLSLVILVIVGIYYQSDNISKYMGRSDLPETKKDVKVVIEQKTNSLQKQAINVNENLGSTNMGKNIFKLSGDISKLKYAWSNSFFYSKNANSKQIVKEFGDLLIKKIHNSGKGAKKMYRVDYNVKYYSDKPIVLKNGSNIRKSLVYSGFSAKRDGKDLIFTPKKNAKKPFIGVVNIYKTHLNINNLVVYQKEALVLYFEMGNLLEDMAVSYSGYKIKDIKMGAKSEYSVDLGKLFADKMYDLKIKPIKKVNFDDDIVKDMRLYKYTSEYDKYSAIDFSLETLLGKDSPTTSSGTETIGSGEESTKYVGLQEFSGDFQGLRNLNLSEFANFGLVKISDLDHTSEDDQEIIAKIDALPFGKYLLYIRDRNDFGYFYYINVTDKFGYKAYSSGDLLTNTYDFDFPVVSGGLEAQLTTVLGTGNYSIKLDDSIIKLKYYIPPKEKVTGDLTVANIFGGTTNIPLNLYMEEIPNKYKYVSVYAQRLNILPANGYWGDKIKIGFKNFTGFDLYFQPCELAKPNFELKGSQYIDEYFMQCDSKSIYSQHIQKDFEYWKKYEMEYPIPNGLSGQTYFRVSFYDDFKSSKYFIRSNIGIFTKVAKDKINVWAVNYDDGKMLDNGDVIMYDANMKQLTKTKLLSGYAHAQLTGNTTDLIMLQVNSVDDTNFIILTKSGDGWYYHSENDKHKSFNILSKIDGYDIGQNSCWGDANTVKIYGYTDRGLYRVGDEIFFSGWVRDLFSGSKAVSGSVIVGLRQYGSEIEKIEINELDAFGGFKGKFQLGKSADLGDYTMRYEFQNSSFSHDIKVEEFQKPTFFVENESVEEDGKVYLIVNPQYYFGEPVKDYDLDMTFAVKGDDICWYCWWWNDQDFYYNHVFGDTFNTGGNVAISGYTGNKSVFELIDISNIDNRGYKFSIKGDIKVKDNNSDETHVNFFYHTVYPSVEIGLDGQPADWVYSNEKDTFSVLGNIRKGKEEVKKIDYIWYYKPFWYDEEKGVDGSYYYINGYKFVHLLTGQISEYDTGDFVVPNSFTGAGEYFLRVITYNDKGFVNGEVQKRLYYYDYTDYYGSVMGDQTNNFVLTVNIPKKKYAEGEDITVDINPYISGAIAIVTVERGNNILDKFESVLDDTKLTIKAKKEYFPNANISVVLFVGENQNSLGKRKEPRFYIGYGNADLDDNMVKLNIEIKTDKEIYKPGEEVKFTIYTTNDLYEPVDARLSIGIVDKSLADLYDLIKEPIPYFYNKIGSYISNSSNWKMLYQALRVFTGDGEKGGGGGSANSLNLRKKFEDLAYWRGGVYTSGGKIELKAILPDNLTTWMVDVIGITKDIKLGTNRHYFQTQQPLMVSPNMPLFLTLGDKIDLPVNVVVTEQFKQKLGTGNIQIKGTIYYENGKEVDLGTQEVGPDTKAIFELSIPQSLYLDTYAKLLIEAQGAGEKDAVEQILTIRSNGFVLSQFMFTGDKKGEYKFSFDDTTQFVKANLNISKLPINAFEKAFDYLLKYPYGCTEQMMSGLYPIIVASKLAQSGFVSEKYIKEDKVNLGGYKSWISIYTVIDDTLTKIYKNQKSDGGMGYWEDENEKSYSYLSAYVYGALKLIQQMGYDVSEPFMNDLGGYLGGFGESEPMTYLYYTWYQSLEDIDTVNTKQVKQIVNSNSEDIAIKILAFAILANSKDTKTAMQYRQNIDFDNVTKQSDWHFSFLEKDILKAIYLRGLLKLDSDDANIKAEIRQIMLDFLRSRDSSGRWGWSTQKNIQILLALGDYLEKQLKSEEDTTCDVTIGQNKFKIKLDKANISQTREMSFDKVGDSLDTNWECNQDVLMDISLNYILNDLSKIKNKEVNLTGLKLTLSGGNNIGDIVQLKGTFQPLKDAQQVAVEFYIPANIKLLANISKMTDTLPFEYGKWTCRPSHYEVRFDRLFLYYKNLKAKTKCTIKFKGIKAYNGVFNIMPSRLFEMYRTEVWGQNSSVDEF